MVCWKKIIYIEYADEKYNRVTVHLISRTLEVDFRKTFLSICGS